MPTLKAPSTGPKRAEKSDAEGVAAAVAATQKYASQLQRIPEIAAYGGVLKSSQLIELTEPQTEYVVAAVKHIFKEHIVLQFDVKNTLPDIVLADVSIASTPAEDDGEPSLEEDFIIPIAKLAADQTATAYVAFRRTDPSNIYLDATFTNILKFTTKEIDPSTGEAEEGGYEDEYEVGELALTGSDYVVPAFAGSFDVVWDQAGAGEEASETLQLSNMKSLADATEQLARALSLQPLEGTDVTLTTSTHTLKLYGKTITGGRVAALVRMAFSAKTGVTTKITARGEEPGIAALMVASVA